LEGVVVATLPLGDLGLVQGASRSHFILVHTARMNSV
jgi:hypothetical protein